MIGYTCGSNDISPITGTTYDNGQSSWVPPCEWVCPTWFPRLLELSLTRQSTHFCDMDDPKQSGIKEHRKQAKKRKGGAEKLRDKRKKALEEDASTSKKITDMFGGRGAPIASSGNAIASISSSSSGASYSSELQTSHVQDPDNSDRDDDEPSQKSCDVMVSYCRDLCMFYLKI